MKSIKSQQVDNNFHNIYYQLIENAFCVTKIDLSCLEIKNFGNSKNNSELHKHTFLRLSAAPTTAPALQQLNQKEAHKHFGRKKGQNCCFCVLHEGVDCWTMEAFQYSARYPRTTKEEFWNPPSPAEYWDMKCEFKFAENDWETINQKTNKLFTLTGVGASVLMVEVLWSAFMCLSSSRTRRWRVKWGRSWSQ